MPLVKSAASRYNLFMNRIKAVNAVKNKLVLVEFRSGGFVERLSNNICQQRSKHCPDHLTISTY
jgi:hypothetical protein